MAISVEEIENKQVEIPPTRRDYFTIPEFGKIRTLLPDYELELIHGEITINKRAPLQLFSIADFERVAREFPDHRIELINREIMRFTGDQVLPAPGLAFLQITPGLIFAE